MIFYKKAYLYERALRQHAEQQLEEFVIEASKKNESLRSQVSEIYRLNRYIDELKAQPRIFVVAESHQHFIVWCRANGYEHRDGSKAIFLSTNDYRSGHGHRRRHLDRVVLYGPWERGRDAREVVAILMACGFKREEMEEVRDA
jgi:hypothetical protein